jgi:AcrR family transcriptional regulator
VSRPATAPAPAEALPLPREEQMLDELETIFLRDGFRSVTVDQLARELRCSKRSLYALAPSKEELFLRVFDRYLSRLREEGARGAMAVRPEEAFAPYLLPAIDAARKLSATLIRDMTAYAPANDMWERHQRERMAGLRALVERCVDEGIFRNANAYLVAEVVAASLRRIREPRFLAASKLSYREAVSELYGLLLHGLLHPEAADTPQGP